MTPGEFLRVVTSPGTWMTVVAINPETNACTGKAFQRESIADAVAFINQHDHDNLYWSVNPLTRRRDKKPTKADVRDMRWVHVDIDDPADVVLGKLCTGSME